MYDELADEAWYVRHSVRLMRRFKRLRSSQKIGLACSTALALLVLYALLNALFGFDRVATLDERSSSLYGTLQTHTDAFEWDAGVRDAHISAHVLAAREALADTRGMTLVANERADEPASRALRCKDLFSVTDNSTDVLSALFYRTARYLRANRDERCACAPQFGERVRYVAFLTKTDLELARRIEEHNGGAETLDVADDGSAVYHALNPHDSLADAYERLDESNTALPDLTVVDERQAERYNDAYRGDTTFALLRRERVRLELMDRQCHAQAVQVKGALAHCVQRCLDLLDGVSVARRAERQYDVGVRLNAAPIEVERAHRRQQSLDAPKDEL